jgi:hypothetical protein
VTLGAIISREASGGAIKGTFFASRGAKVSADVTFWSGDSCRCAAFFARPADSAGPFFVVCFTIYRGCLLWVFVGARSRDAFCRRRRRRRLLHSLCARDADVYVQSTWTTFGSLWAPRDVMVKEIRLFSTHRPNQLLSRVAASRNVSIPENSNSRSHNSQQLTALSLFSNDFSHSPSDRFLPVKITWHQGVFNTIASLKDRWLNGLTLIACENQLQFILDFKTGKTALSDN